jgi:hypothetical protein
LDRGLALNAGNEVPMPIEVGIWRLNGKPERIAWEKGLFAIQHTACRLRSSFTIERIVKHFGIED